MATIMVVDDDKELLPFFTTLLTMHNYEVVAAESKTELDKTLTQVVPDLILLDVRLSGFDGREVCREIKEKNLAKYIPVVLLSASPELLKDYEECGAIAVIEKPFDINTILDTIERFLK